MKVAVVGHVEACAFASVDHVPGAGEIVEAEEGWEQAAGGGAVAAVQLARLAGECLFLTALADDRFGRAAQRDLEDLGLRVEAAWRSASQRRAFVHLDAAGERTITVTGDRLAPAIADPLPWRELEVCDAVYLTAGDRGAAVAARKATRVVATVRARRALIGSGVELDVLVASAGDRGERYSSGMIEPPPRAVVLTAGAEGGVIETTDGTEVRWAAPPLPGPPVDAYGAGDSFAGGLTYGLAQGLPVEQAVALAARCGAACVTGRGPYEGQLAGPQPTPGAVSG
jgi:ribokinase